MINNDNNLKKDKGNEGKEINWMKFASKSYLSFRIFIFVLCSLEIRFELSDFIFKSQDLREGNRKLGLYTSVS